MATRYSPTIRRRRLSAELVRIRRAAGLTSEQLAAKLEMSKSSYSNIETGAKQRPTITEVRAILDACEMQSGREYEEILDLARQSRERGWWARYGDVLSTKYVGFETEASTITTWEPTVIPGLLQVPAYMEVLAQAALAHPEDARRAVDARIKRQQILTDEDPPELWAIFDETALLRLDDYPEVRRAQVTHLLEMAQQPNVTLQMTEASKLNPGSGGPFVLLDFPNTVDPTVIYLETDTDGLYLERPDEVARYRNLINHLRLGALRPGETISRLEQIE